jgi:hypothetical protein
MSFSQSNQTYPYLVCDVRTEYLLDRGRRPVSVSYWQSEPGNQKPIEVVSTAKSEWRKVVTFTMKRLIVPPELPSAAGLPGEELLYAALRPEEPTLDADGKNTMYSISGTYEFSVATPAGQVPVLWPSSPAVSPQQNTPLSSPAR